MLDLTKSKRRSIEKFILEDCSPNDQLEIKSDSGNFLVDCFVVNKTQGIVFCMNFKEDFLDDCKKALEYLNIKCSKNFKDTPATQRLISSVFRKGYSVDDIVTVINTKSAKWIGTSMEEYLRPSTLFGPKFDEYLNEGLGKGQMAMSTLDTIQQKMKRENHESETKYNF